jgi:hypothetical protein
MNRQIVLKMHGSIDAPNETIFSRDDYAKARTDYRDFYSVLDALTITNTFLFIGCGLNDPDIRILLEDYRYRFKYSRNHYFTIPKKANPEFVNDVLGDSLNLTFLKYDSTSNHIELTNSLTQLVSAVDLKRSEIAQQQSW